MYVVVKPTRCIGAGARLGGVVDLDPPGRVNPDLAEGADPIVARRCGVERELFAVKLDLSVEDFLALPTACDMQIDRSWSAWRGEGVQHTHTGRVGERLSDWSSPLVGPTLIRVTPSVDRGRSELQGDVGSRRGQGCG